MLLLSICLEIGGKISQNAINVQQNVTKSKYINLCSDILSGVKSVLVINCNAKTRKCLQFVIMAMLCCFVDRVWGNEK